MNYYFEDFHFDAKRLELAKGGEALPLRPKTAELLALLLSDSEKVFSKEDIFRRVWTDNIVSEQAIFQNISELRALIGDSAIKTFPKRGYQWQLPLSSSPLGEKDKRLAELFSHFGSGLKFAALSLVAVIALSALYFFNASVRENRPDKSETLPKIAVLPFSLSVESQADKWLELGVMDVVHQRLVQSGRFDPVDTASVLTLYDLIPFPDQHRDAILDKLQAQFILNGAVTVVDGELTVTYWLSGKQRSWSGELNSPSVLHLAEHLVTQLETVFTANLMVGKENNMRLLNAQLQVAQEKNPDDLSILYQLAASYLTLGDLNNTIQIAEILLDEAKEQQQPAYLIKGYFKLAEAYIESSELGLASEHIQAGKGIADSRREYWSLGIAYELKARVAKLAGDYQSSKNAFHRAAVYAHQAHCKLAEINHKLDLSALAQQYSEHKESAHYLYEAELLLDQYRMPQEHYAGIYLLKAQATEDPIRAEQLYLRALALFRPEQLFWTKSQAQAGLKELYVSQRRWQDAVDMFSRDEKALHSYEKTLLASVYLGWGKIRKSEMILLETFAQANRAGEVNEALSSALMLYQIYATQNKFDKTRRYQNYIEGNASAHWLNQNRLALVKAGLTMEKLGDYLGARAEKS